MNDILLAFLYPLGELLLTLLYIRGSPRKKSSIAAKIKSLSKSKEIMQRYMFVLNDYIHALIFKI